MENTVNDPPQMRLYGPSNERLYINAAERARFLQAATTARPDIASFALTLLYTGCRISEALMLTRSAMQPEQRIITFRTLKRRRVDYYREVPVPAHLMNALIEAHHSANSGPHDLLWQRQGRPIGRVTAYRWIKALMAHADIVGAQACPKGLRHGYGIHALRSGVQLNMLQKWMGHADMSTTAIYANAIGEDELRIADRMW